MSRPACICGSYGMVRNGVPGRCLQHHRRCPGGVPEVEDVREVEEVVG